MTPGMAKVSIIVSLPLLLLMTLVVSANLYGYIVGIPYSPAALVIFTILCLGVVYVITQYQQVIKGDS
jgi:hypothetical protein